MAIELTFNDPQSCQDFALKHNLGPTAGQTVQVPWHILNHAKNNPEINTMLSQDTAEHEFIVKCTNTELLTGLATIVQELGSNFFLVKSANGIELSKVVDSIEITSLPVQFLGVANPTNLNGEATTIDPTTSDAQWARLRVATRYRPLKTSFRTHSVVYNSIPELYILDSGINFNHPEFDDPNIEHENFYALPVFNGDFADDVGHGTGVASMAVGKNLGIAAKCKLINVKVGSTTHTATVFELGQAIDAIVARASANPLKTRIVNMSFGVTRSEYLDHKVQGMIDMGITVVCAAGNQGIDVELISPAGLDSVVTVGSVDKYDIPSGFNNISPSDSGLTTSSGLSLDIFAPGEKVVHANNTGTYSISSGTSFAAPLVAGVLTEIASLYSEALTVTQLKQKMFDTATEHALLFDNDKFTDNQNRLIYLATVDENTNYKNENLVSYVGVHSSPTDTITADLNSCLSETELKKLFPNETFTYEIKFLDPDVEKDYAQFMNLNSTTGILTINYPTVELPAETKLKMIEFVAVLKSSRTTQESHTIFYFATNPNYADTIQSDITLALTEVNSISFYGIWNLSIK